MAPKEHGAYAILIVPLIVSLVIAGANFVSISIAVAALAGFFAHEPLLIAIGHRGKRAKRTTPKAKSRAILLISLASIAGTLSLGVGNEATRISLALCLVLAAASFFVAIVGQHRTLGGQLLGVLGLSAPSVPIVLAGGNSVEAALAFWSVWLLGFTATMLAVRGVIAAQKRKPRSLHWAILTLISAAIIVTGFAFTPLLLAAVPMIIGGWILMLRPPPAKHLKRVGWTLVGVTMTTAMVVIVAI